MDYFTSALLGYFVTVFAVWLLCPLARRWGLVDHPGGRKKHQGEIPLIGGWAMYCGVLAALPWIPPMPDSMSLLTFFGAAGLLLVVGTFDDRYNLPYPWRFGAQAAAAVLMIYGGGVALNDLGALLSTQTLALGGLTLPFTVFATVGMVNAVNMSDGMDGLAGGLCLVALMALGIAAAVAGHETWLGLFPVLIAVTAAFLGFNIRSPWRSHARIFMGNGGSLFLGFAVCWLLIALSQGAQKVISPVVALWIFALPLLDTVAVMIRRITKGHSPFAPDREHLHHILLLAGYTPSQAVWIMLTLAAGLAAIGLGAFYMGIPDSVLFFGFLTLFGLYVWAMHRAWKLMKALRREESTPSSREPVPIERPAEHRAGE